MVDEVTQLSCNMSGQDALPIELVRRSKGYPVPYRSRMIQYEKSQAIYVHRLPPRKSASSKFDLLPAELLQDILLSLDFQALRCLRAVNFAIKQLVEAFPAYRDVVEYAPNALRALADTNLLSYFSATQVHTILQSDRCSTCNDYGPYLFLLTCRRCCILCLEDKPQLRVIPVSRAQQQFGKASLAGIPMILSLPGNYGLPSNCTATGPGSSACMRLL